MTSEVTVPWLEGVRGGNLQEPRGEAGGNLEEELGCWLQYPQREITFVWWKKLANILTSSLPFVS